MLCPLQIDSNLPRGRSGTVLNGGAAAAGAEDRPALLVMQALEAITRISKGLPSALVTRTRPKLGVFWMPYPAIGYLASSHTLNRYGNSH